MRNLELKSSSAGLALCIPKTMERKQFLLLPGDSTASSFSFQVPLCWNTTTWTKKRLGAQNPWGMFFLNTKQIFYMIEICFMFPDETSVERTLGPKWALPFRFSSSHLVQNQFKLIFPPGCCLPTLPPSFLPWRSCFFSPLLLRNLFSKPFVQ